MVETLGITMDRSPKGRPRKMIIKKIEKIYNSLAPLQQEEIRKETENRLPDFWKEKLNKVRDKEEISMLLEVVLKEKRREIIKEWIKSGRIEVWQRTVPYRNTEIYLNLSPEDAIRDFLNKWQLRG